MAGYVLELEQVDRSHASLVGGKGAHLGELVRIDGVRVPTGFCVTTNAYRRIVADARPVGRLLDRLASLRADDSTTIRDVCAELRQILEEATVPHDVMAAISRALGRLGQQTACAVRSSATAEDLPTASFAGQQDSYLNIVGPAAVLQHVRRCWASLFTERAVTYRMRNGFDHRSVHMAVVVQRMVFADAAGVLFTADPVSGHRKVASVEASFGLGEALVSGRVNPDIFTVRDGEVVARALGAKRLVIRAAAGGGTQEQEVEVERQARPSLTDAQVVRLERLGRRIEAHFGMPQDIEWCLADDEFHIVQSRPITTLFPVPDAGDDEIHVYVSVGHQQMMTDAMKPLGLSFWQLSAGRPMYEAGGRLFVDVAAGLATPEGRAGLLGMVGRSDPLIGDALRTLIDRGDVAQSPAAVGAPIGGPVAGVQSDTIETDPAIVAGLIERTEASLATLEHGIRGKSGTALLDFIRADIPELQRMLFDPLSNHVLMAGIEASWWLNERLHEWLGETNAADVLTRSVPHNVTSEMGLELLTVADAIRPHPEVVSFLEGVEHDGFLDELPEVAGGREACAAIRAWLDRYGMRCVGEIDITRPRWSEKPTMLVPALLGNVRNAEPGAGARRFEQGLHEARAREAELLERLRALPDGEAKATETKRMIDRVRTFIGYREYPKYGWMCRFFVYKQALLEEAARLVRTGVLRDEDDIFYLRFEELQDLVRTGRADDALIRQRRDAFRAYQSLTPPRVLTSDGEAITGTYRRDDLPPDALVGLAVSAGTVEGRARVILDMADADLEPGDILVTVATDPSWTPLFLAVDALVTEVGGLMTHGAVIAREYGLPAVVGVEHATQRIRDGQRIRVHGTEGYVEVLS